MSRLTQLPHPAALYEGAKMLWRICFPEDDAAFVDYYFETRTAPECVFCVENDEHDGHPAAMLHALPRRFEYMGSEYSARLIAGVATHPGYRGRGLAGGLINEAREYFTARGVDALILQPAAAGLFGFYERLGFRAMCNYVKLRIYPTTAAKSTPTLPSPEHCLNAYNAFRTDFSGAFLREEADFSALIREYTSCGGFAHAFNGGYAFGYVIDGVLDISELVGGMTRENIDSIFSVCDCRTMKFTVPESMAARAEIDFASEKAPFNMILPLSNRARGLEIPFDDFLSFEGY